jgi:NhaP-type Na+/H+ or K+/H+ antiporter
MDQAMRHLLSFIGAIVTIAGLLSLLTSQSVKTWIKDHSYLVFIVLILSVTTASVVIDYVLSKKRRIATAHDRKIAEGLLNELPPDGSLIVWLKEFFISKSIPVKYLDLLEHIASQMHLNVVGLDNPEANQAYRRLESSAYELHSLACFNLFTNEDYTLMQNSPDWPWEQWQEASKQISEARSALVEAYDEFLQVCHKGGLDS